MTVKTKRLVAAASVAVAISGLASAVTRAQQPTPQQMEQFQKFQKKMQADQKALGITAAQEAKMKAIDEKYRQKAIAMGKQREKEMMAVLTPTQRAKAQKMRAEAERMQRQMMQQMPGQGSSGAKKR